MKTGRPEYYIPSVPTVTRDVKQVFVKVRGRVAKMLQVRNQVSYLMALDEINSTYLGT
jgi:hypothetical protein